MFFAEWRFSAIARCSVYQGCPLNTSDGLPVLSIIIASIVNFAFFLRCASVEKCFYVCLASFILQYVFVGCCCFVVAVVVIIFIVYIIAV
jgi:hypothetical protein